ncbi:SusC/RagA family TonB-linked outer membrane protein [Flagellimonas nanhaiensis]|uniref:SusC/RagA family TonB-linked outer membrane protein n=1 Tax=Flagellimonas nanhaiensis TaxID=2292706 RepID=A0A371JLT7_9FLAO|nr:SusC/RagA family TonB-linked outer membrane protein [Allomuricauda nanhaiensis]RDY57947.1 SusC/RagA family TonB-linked outer membrane protein [Allomuricauda nanhaiensis]
MKFSSYWLIFFGISSFFIYGNEGVNKIGYRISNITVAQNTLTGNVTDSQGLPLPGVNVIIKGTNTGTQTDFDGNYAISATQGDIVVFSYIGFASQELPVPNDNVLNVVMTEDVSRLQEVVVTAQGIRREKRSLGYAISELENDKIEDRPEGDLGRVLRGKAAGLNITSTNGLAGSGTNILIRGFASITGDNQPLFVVNGVPFDGSTNNENAFFDGINESSRFLDIDPNSIEKVAVLKGLSASVLYGERGRNGVILITTKSGSTASGKNKTEITVAQSAFFTDAILPNYQDNYGGGFHQNLGFFFSNHGPSFNPGDLSNQAIDSNPLFLNRQGNQVFLVNPLSQLNDQSLVTGFEDIANSPYEYRPYNSVEEFFKQGITTSTSINISGGSEKTSFNMNYGYLNDQGFTPGNSLLRNTFGVGGTAQLTNKFTINGALNFSRTGAKSPPVAASTGSGVISNSSSVFGDVLYTPRNIDLFGLPFQSLDGRSVYYRSGNDIQNPRWTVANAKATQDTDRVFGNLNVNYQFNDWITATYRLGIDTYTEFNTNGQNRGGVDGDVTGIFRTITRRNTTWDHSFILNGDKNITEDLNLKVILGATSRRDEFQQTGVESTNQIVFGVLEHFNFVNSSSAGSFFSDGGNFSNRSEINTLGVYGDVTLGYKDFLYLNGAVRTDWTSTLERENNSITYPGVSLSFIPTTAIDGLKSSNILNYMKVRFGYGTSAGFPGAYTTRNVLALNARLFVDRGGNVISSNAVSNVLGNPDLKPETIREYELGMDTRLFNNKLGLNVSVFKRETRDLITNQSLDPSTGFTSRTINAGAFEAEGIEVDFDFTPFSSQNGFAWNVSGNFYADENIVTELPEGTENISLTPTITGTVANYAVEGMPVGVLLGNRVVRTNGQLTVDNNGDYITGPSSTEFLGDPNPDWTATLDNGISFKGFSFNMSWQYRHGGEVYSQTARALVGRGVVDADRPLDREKTYVLPGVKQDGSPNDIQLTTTRIYFNNLGFGSNEWAIYDGTTLRLNEASLGYSFPKKFLDKTPFGALSFTVSGSNLWFRAFNFPKNVNFDTNVLSTGVGNGQGIDFISGPSARRYGFTLRATF